MFHRSLRRGLGALLETKDRAVLLSPGVYSLRKLGKQCATQWRVENGLRHSDDVLWDTLSDEEV